MWTVLLTRNITYHAVLQTIPDSSQTEDLSLVTTMADYYEYTDDDSFMNNSDGEARGFSRLQCSQN